MRNIQMNSAPGYPFSDLSQVQVDQLIEAARVERSRALRRFLASLFLGHRKRETQVWTPEHAPALGFKPHC
jgi:hypothetical protein